MTSLRVWHERAPDGPWFVAVEGEGDIYIGCGEENGKLAHKFAAAPELYEALEGLLNIIDAAGLLNLSNGVQLGQTSWYVKAGTRVDIARAILVKARGEA